MKYDKHLFLRHLSFPCKPERRKLLHCTKKISQHLLKPHAKACIPLKEKAQRKIHLKRYAALSFLSLSLTGCMGIYEGGFECPAGTGVGCKSISEVNAMVNQGALPKSHSEISIETGERIKTCSACGCSSGPTQERPNIWINPLYLEGLQEKTQEEPRDDTHEESQDIRQQKVLDGTISL